MIVNSIVITLALSMLRCTHVGCNSSNILSYSNKISVYHEVQRSCITQLMNIYGYMTCSCRRNCPGMAAGWAVESDNGLQYIILDTATIGNNIIPR